MEIKLQEIKIRDLVEGFEDNEEAGVMGYNGKLNIRPAYQREFVYKPAQQAAVIDTVSKGFPLNVMYWVGSEGSYEVLDGQQRTLSICSYVEGDFNVEGLYFHNLPQDKQEDILDYSLMVYVCEGKESEKLEWFKTINIAGEKLTDQELRNSVYTGRWLSDAKKYFSKTACPAYQKGKTLVKGVPNRQDYLETVISWINNGDIEGYMAEHQIDPNAGQLWSYFQNVIDWADTVFPNYRKEMKGVNWGKLYNQHKDTIFDQDELELRVKELMMDEDVTKKSGIFEYVLTGNQRVLSVRSFTDKQKREAYETQSGTCPSCQGHFELAEMEGDHVTPWSQGGHTTQDNLQMLCKPCNRTKSNV